MYFIENLHWFVLFIGPLITFHELGHFFVAKACNVKVLRFSIGFGPRLFGLSWRGTEYWLSALPLGGYVKMLGEVPGAPIPPEDADLAFSSKPVWQRSLIALAGPVFNFALAVVVYFAIGLGSHTFLDTRIGVVTYDDPAWRAGMRPGDKIVAIDGEPVEEWNDLRERISTRPGETLKITFARNGESHVVAVTPAAEDETNLFREIETHGRVGISPTFVEPIIGVTDPASPAADAGLKTGDVVEKVGATRVEAWHELRTAVERVPEGEPIPLTIRRGDERRDVEVNPVPYPGSLGPTFFSAADARGGYTGLVSKESLVATVEDDTPAATIGLQPGDRLLRLRLEKSGTVVDRPIGVWGIDLKAFSGVDATADFVLTFQRGRQVLSRDLKLVEREETDEFRNKRRRYVFGASNDPETVSTYTYDRSVGPTESLQGAFASVGFAATLISKGLAKLAQGDLPLDSVGGPIMLFVIAEKSAKRGIRDFLGMLAIISVNLGLLNLLPIPVLDGGHLMIFGVEAVRRRPPSVRAREIASFVGLALLIILMVWVFHNDIMRFVSN